jgi:hypothetical protein
LRTAGVVSATGNITGGNITTTGNIEAGNLKVTGIEAVTTLTVSGDTLISGNLTVSGNTITANVSSIVITDPILGLGRGANGSPLASNDGLDRGIEMFYYTTAEQIAFMGFNNSTGKMLSAANVSIANNIVTVNSLGTTVVGTLEAAIVSATGNVTGGNVNTAGVVSSTGNVQGGNLRTAGLISATGSITGASVVGGVMTGSSLSVTGTVTGASVVGGVMTGTSLSVSGNVTGGNLNTAGVMSSTGNVQAGNVRTAGLISATGQITGSQFNGSGAGLTSIPNGALTNSSITVNGTAISLGGSGTVTANAATLTGTVLNATVVTSSLTSVGTLGSLSVTGNVQGGNLRTAGLISATGAITGGAITGSSLTVSTGNVTCGNIVSAGANGVGNIGSASNFFDTVFAKATSAQYADLAEMYLADQILEPGTVVCFGGAHEVTVCDQESSPRVAGVVSTNPSYIMNAGLQGSHPTAIALTGRVPTRVTGTVRKGDMMVAAGGGRARADANPRIGTVIGKALADFDGQEGVIEVVIGRM